MYLYPDFFEMIQSINFNILKKIVFVNFFFLDCVDNESVSQKVSKYISSNQEIFPSIFLDKTISRIEWLNFFCDILHNRKLFKKIYLYLLLKKTFLLSGTGFQLNFITSFLSYHWEFSINLGGRNVLKKKGCKTVSLRIYSCLIQNDLYHLLLKKILSPLKGRRKKGYSRDRNPSFYHQNLAIKQRTAHLSNTLSRRPYIITTSQKFKNQNIYTFPVSYDSLSQKIRFFLKI